MRCFRKQKRRWIEKIAGKRLVKGYEAGKNDRQSRKENSSGLSCRNSKEVNVP